MLGWVASAIGTVPPYPGIFAYYDGRTGRRFHSEDPNWLDDGAFTLGVCTYSIVSGSEALFIDAGITTNIAAYMLKHVTTLGVTNTSMVYSHYHNDHIADLRSRRKDALAKDDPPIEAVLPSMTYENKMTLHVADRTVKLHHFDIHTPDGTAIFLPLEKVLFVGDMLEDTVTFIDDPTALATHQGELKRMAQLPCTKILPAHGSPDRIKAGGYDKSFIEATLRYIQAVNEPVEAPIAW
ncbi:Metallo-hydrolase/oxidoreductase [Setomelanomma holmii]|uniref:Metallo-hydrolase/oxidoreductase n=1 Tax=Setomelanomma holmii TaxID=210430 RepID=A0A9P4GTM5_9PLEO|nr:Metallo-hydrolase/oxidoreductase [Setomelanomma holmii]